MNPWYILGVVYIAISFAVFYTMINLRHSFGSEPTTQLIMILQYVLMFVVSFFWPVLLIMIGITVGLKK